MKSSVKIKHTAAWGRLKNNPAAFSDYLPCPVKDCGGKSKSSDGGKTFVCPICFSKQKIQLQNK